MSKGSDIVAGDAGAKPTVHISNKDADIAEEQGRENKSMSTVKTEWAEESRQLKAIQAKKKEITEKDDITLGDLLELWRLI